MGKEEIMEGFTDCKLSDQGITAQEFTNETKEKKFRQYRCKKKSEQPEQKQEDIKIYNVFRKPRAP